MKKILILSLLMLGCPSNENKINQDAINARSFLSENTRYYKDMTANVCYVDFSYIDSVSQTRFRYLPCTPEIEEVAIKFQSIKLSK